MNGTELKRVKTPIELDNQLVKLGARIKAAYASIKHLRMSMGCPGRSMGGVSKEMIYDLAVL